MQFFITDGINKKSNSQEALGSSIWWKLSSPQISTELKLDGFPDATLPSIRLWDGHCEDTKLVTPWGWICVSSLFGCWDSSHVREMC